MSNGLIQHNRSQLYTAKKCSRIINLIKWQPTPGRKQHHTWTRSEFRHAAGIRWNLWTHLHKLINIFYVIPTQLWTIVRFFITEILLPAPIGKTNQSATIPWAVIILGVSLPSISIRELTWHLPDPVCLPKNMCVDHGTHSTPAACSPCRVM